MDWFATKRRSIKFDDADRLYPSVDLKLRLLKENRSRPADWFTGDDVGLFGGTTHAYNGVRLTLPLGGYKYVRRNTSLALNAAPFGHDTGQRLNTPLPLYDLTENFTAREMAEYWSNITE